MSVHILSDPQLHHIESDTSKAFHEITKSINQSIDELIRTYDKFKTGHATTWVPTNFVLLANNRTYNQNRKLILGTTFVTHLALRVESIKQKNEELARTTLRAIVKRKEKKMVGAILTHANRNNSFKIIQTPATVSM
jgi:sugar-specific transcriptional regulator TrmB